MADNNTIARPYAQAAFDFAQEKGNLGGWASALEVARSLLANGEVVTFLANPTLSDEQKLEFLAGLIGSAGSDVGVLSGDDKNGTNFLKLLIEYGRMNVLPEIAEHFDVLKAAVENTVDVIVTSAAPMTAEQQATIAGGLKKRLGRNVNLRTEIDENLIGGAVIRAGDVVIDGSLRARLTSLTNALIS
jgi:F-type H+-transporting ATPase subunit delta